MMSVPLATLPEACSSKGVRKGPSAAASFSASANSLSRSCAAFFASAASLALAFATAFAASSAAFTASFSALLAAAIASFSARAFSASSRAFASRAARRFAFATSAAFDSTPLTTSSSGSPDGCTFFSTTSNNKMALARNLYCHGSSVAIAVEHVLQAAIARSGRTAKLELRRRPKHF